MDDSQLEPRLQTSLYDLSCREFAEALASKEPVPGGGGTAALTGALAASLCSMVGNLTLGKKKYAEYEDEIRLLMSRAEELREDLLELIEKDREAFEPLSRAYAMPAGTDEEKQIKQDVMEECLRTACDTPMEIIQKVSLVASMLEDFRVKGSVIAVSDVGVSAALCTAALQSASLNVYINTRMMKDREYAAALNAECDELLRENSSAAEEVFNKIRSSLTEPKGF